MDEIRQVGRFVFYEDKHRLVGYRSQYMSQVNSRRKDRNKKGAKPTPQEEF